MKILISFILCLNIMLAEQEDTNIVKTSELELFLFKIGFESLLKDVDNTKSKTNLNEEELKKLNSKIEIIMDEIYKDKRVLKSDNSSVVIQNTVNNNELVELKKEIELLKTQMNELKQNRIIVKKEEKDKSNKIKEDKNNIYKVSATLVNLRDKATSNSNIVGVLTEGTLVTIDSCDKFGWCKLKGEDKYISKFLLKF